jgi:poly-gamma-glutamate synthesis protein (capsule biosynthesis protein)
MIDRGAMAVIGDHPHWIQTAESYKGKPIFYSLGNFMFDQQYNLEVTRSAGIDVTLSVEDSPSLAGWLELASDPSLNLTSAVARAEQLGLAPYSVKATYDIVGIRDDGRLPHPADKAEQADIEARLGWAELEEEFG